MNLSNAIGSTSNSNESNNTMNINGPAWTSKSKKKNKQLVEEEIEAPYLTHNIRHHGVYTLSPSDNMGRRRQPDLEFNNNSNNLDDLTIDNSKNKKGKEKRKKVKSKVVDPEILQAVENVGRTLSPLPSSNSNQGVLSRPTFDRNSSSILSFESQTVDIITSSTLDVRRDLGEGTSSGAERLYTRDDLYEDDDTQDQPLPAFIPSPSLLPTIDSHSHLLPSDPSSLYDPPPAYPSPVVSNTPSSILPLSTPLSTVQTQNIEVESDGDESQEEEFTFHASDPFVIAWESDRRVGLSLDERILRDLLRRKGSNVVSIDSIPSTSSTLPSLSVVETALPSSNIPTLTPTTSSFLEAIVQTSTDESLISPHIRNEIESAELAQDTPRVARALSVLASNRKSSIGAANRASMATGRRRRRDVVGEIAELSSLHVAAEKRKTVATRENQDSLVHSEAESDDEGPSKPARMISLNAGARFAEAAERRRQLARLNEITSNSNHSVLEISEEVQNSINSIDQEIARSSPNPTLSLSQSLVSPSIAGTSSISSRSLPAVSEADLFTKPSQPLQSLPSIVKPSAISTIRDRHSIPTGQRSMNELRAMFESPASSISRTNISASNSIFLPHQLPKRPSAALSASTQTNSHLTSTSISSNITRASSPSILSHIPQSDQEQLIAPLVPTISPLRPSTLPADVQPTHSSSSSTIIRPPLPTPPSSNNIMPRLSAYDVVRRMQNEQSRTLGPSTSTLSGSTISRSGNVAITASSNIAPSESSIGTVVFNAVSSDQSEGVVGEMVNATRVEESTVVADDFAYTDLDLLLARLEDRARDGSNYDELMLVSEVLGPSRSASSSLSDIESLNIAKVELVSRRIDKFGKVKQKLSVVGVRCGDCSVCLGRFKVGAWAVVLPECLHIFHADCIRSWLLRSKLCPLCRAEVFLNVEI